MAAPGMPLMGRLRRVDDCTRIIAGLIDVDTDRHLWGDSFDGSVNDPFALQDRVVDGVLCGVVSSITDAELGACASQGHHRDRAARDLATQALPLILATTVPSTLNAMTLLDRAIELDPSDPLAVALLACCHVQLALYLGTSSPAAARTEAERLARRAALLDGGDPLVTTARSMAMSMSGQCQEGHPLVARALAMDPTSTWAWERSGFSRLCARRTPGPCHRRIHTGIAAEGARPARCHLFHGDSMGPSLGGPVAGGGALGGEGFGGEPRRGIDVSLGIPLCLRTWRSVTHGAGGRAYAPVAPRGQRIAARGL